MKLIPLLTSIFFISQSFCYDFMRVAHRGSPILAPENTLASFRKAIEQNANYLELDIHLTKDGELVVMHDSKVNRTTNGQGEIASFTLKELLTLDAGSGEKVPLLTQVLELLKNNPSKYAIIELKHGSDQYPEIENKLVHLISLLKLDNRVIFKSFDLKILSRLKTLAPQIPTLYVYMFSFMNITIDNFLRFHDPLKSKVDILQPHRFFLTQSFIEAAHKKGYKIVAWDVETKKHMMECLKIGVDGIETDHLDILNEILKN